MVTREPSTLIDPFFGVAGFGLVAGWNGIRVIGVELEEHFVKLAEADIALHKPLWGRGGCVAPVVIHGDSRNLRELVGAAMGGISSPPFGSTGSADGGTATKPEARERMRKGLLPKTGHMREADFSQDPKNLARLPMAGSVSSPPYADDAPGAGGLNTKPPREGSDDQSGRTAGPSQRGVAGSLSSPPYAESLQNPGGSRTPNAPEGFKLGASSPGVAGSVSSPPYSNALTRGDKVPDTPNSERMAEMGGRMAYGKSEGQLGEMPAGSVSSPPFEDSINDGKVDDRWQGWARNPDGSNRLAKSVGTNYGASEGQLGAERGDTFWDALRVIATELHALLPPGAVSAWVVKDFVRKGQRVPFCDDCVTLLEQAGFRVFERWRCWMISKATQTDMFTGETKPEREFKGFFRRLAEAKGSPRIDWEEVIWFTAQREEA